MSNCCTEFYKIGCVASCDCFDTNILFNQAGTYTIQYWYSNSSDRFSINYESDGTNTLILPSEIFVPGSPFYFDILQPDLSYLGLTETVTDVITGLSSEIEYKCFWVETYNKIKRDLRNDCAPVNCSDCNVDHEFTLDPSASNIFLIPGGGTTFQITFTLEQCVQKILLQYVMLYKNGIVIDNNLVNFNITDDYQDGFNAQITIPNDALPGDQFVIGLGFLGFSKKGLDNENCYSNTQTSNIIIDIV